MEQYLRLALWMFLLIGYLQANPVTSTTCKPQEKGFNMEDLGLNFLRNVSCDPRVKFTSPTNVQKHCYFEALKCFMDELMRAANNCTNDWLINNTFEALEQNTFIQEQPDNSECQWEKSKKSFADFVDDMKNFAEQVNSNQTVKC